MRPTSTTVTPRLAIFAALLLAGLAPSPLLAAGTEPEAETPATTATKPADTKPADAKPAATAPATTKPADAKPAEVKKPEEAKPAVEPPCTEADKTKCPKKQSLFIDSYHAAVALIDAGRYPEALAAMEALDDGSSADVINYMGYIHRKMGHMAQAQMYYEAALHMKPNHRGALEYYGEWYCMMGNLPKAKANLATIAAVYGSDTKEYAALARMIDETAAKAHS